VQRASGRLTLRVVPTQETLAPEAEKLIREFVGKHVAGVPLDIEVVREIPLTRAGKLRRVIVEKPDISNIADRQLAAMVEPPVIEAPAQARYPMLAR
jgi:acyl-coenzyme A synthetase/AMP-(fatty) acid ligase